MRILGLEIPVPRLSSQERRKAERVRVHETLYLDYLTPVERGSAEGKDISVSGVRFACSSKLPRGTPVELTLRFTSEYAKDKAPLARGRIVRIYRDPEQRRYRIACAFDPLEDWVRDEIRSYITWLKARDAASLYR